MGQFFLVNQKHSTKPVYNDFEETDSYEPVIFSELETYNKTTDFEDTYCYESVETHNGPVPNGKLHVLKICHKLCIIQLELLD